MSRPFIVVQLSDPHIGAAWADGDPEALFVATVESVLELPDPPGAVIVSGDLADNASDAEYEFVRAVLARIGARMFVLPGNHDDRARLRRHFRLRGGGHESVDYTADIGPLRLVVLGTTKPGADHGELSREQLDWLSAELEAAPSQPTLLAMHHPPFVTGVPVWDEVGLQESARKALADIVYRHSQVRRLVAGHMHCTVTVELAGRTVLAAPSTYVQARLRYATAEIVLASERAGFAVHALRDDDFLSYIEPVA